MKVSFDPALERPFSDRSGPRPAFVLSGSGLPDEKEPLSSRLKAVPGHRRVGGNRSAPEGAIVLPAHPLAAQVLLQAFPTLNKPTDRCSTFLAGPLEPWTPQAFMHAWWLATLPRDKALCLSNPAVNQPQLRASLRALREHQLRAVHAIKVMGFRALLGDDMGLGKTATAIEAYRNWQLAKGATPAGVIPRLTVICPVSVKWNWPKELALQGIDQDQVVVIDGTPKKRADLFSLVPHREVCIINYDLLRWCNESQMKLLRRHVEDAFLILDESHYIKDRTSRRTTIVQTLEPHGLLLLSGTPIRSTAADLYTQIMMLCDVWQNWWEFQDRYLVMGEMNLPGGRKKKVVVGTKNEKELNAVVDCFQIMRKKQDVTDLPPKIHTKHLLAMDDETAAIYAAMKRFWLYTFGDLPDDEDVFSDRARTALEQAMRLEQIAQGFVGGLPEEVVERVAGVLKECGAVGLKGRPRELVFPKSTKLQWTIERIEDLASAGRPAVLWSRFNCPLYWLQEHLGHLGHKATMLHGNLSSMEKQGVIERFQEGKADVLLGQIKMAEGFSLVRSTDVLMFGRDWSHAVNIQAADRCHRIGQKGTVNVEIPIVGETCEVYLDARLEAKEQSASSILAVRTMRDLRDLVG